MLSEKVYAAKEKKIRLSPCHTNRASEAGHPCERYLVLRRTRWQDAALHDVRLQLLFDEGTLQERAVIRDLEDAGYTIIEQQRDYEWKALQLTAHLDGKIVLDQPEPLEVKSMHPFIFDAITSLTDMLRSPKPWIRKYPAQMQLYLLLADAERGWMVLKNKATGELKDIEVRSDLAFTESILRKLERVNSHVASGTIPDPIPYDADICDRCPFYQRVCLPDVMRTAVILSDDPTLAQQLERHAELEAAAKEYAALEKTIKQTVKHVDRAICGHFLIQGKEVSRDGYVVKPTTFWQVTITPLKE